MGSFKQAVKAMLHFAHLDKLSPKAQDGARVQERRIRSRFVRRDRPRKDQQPTIDPGITLSPDVLLELTAGLLNARTTGSKESQCAAKVYVVERELEHCQDHISDLKRRLHHVHCGNIKAPDDEADALKHELNDAKMKSKRLAKLKEQSIEELESVRRQQRNDQTTVIALIEGTLVRFGGLQYNESPPFSLRDFDAILQADQSRDDSVDEVRSRVSRTDYRTTTAVTRTSDKSQAASEQTVLRQDATDDEKAQLLDDFNTLKGWLSMAEQDLEYRHERLDRERREYHEARATGKDVPDLLDFDLDQVLETQRLTQKVAEAEQDLAEAKAKALAAGVDLGSDVESGFVFDDDDGDRVSIEDNDAALADPSVVCRWIDKLPVDRPDPQDEPAQDPEVDDWDARSVEIHDSWSMRAEGAEKRRIERWRDLLEKSIEQAAG